LCFALVSLVCPGVGSLALGQGVIRQFVGEETSLRIRDPAQLARIPLPNVPPPPTVRDPAQAPLEWRIPLDEAIRVALSNSEIVRVLTGVAAASSGRTVYDAAITNTTIDEAKATFDPRLEVNNNFRRTEPPQAFFDPLAPEGVSLGGLQTTTHDLDVGLSKRNILGGDLNLRIDADTSRFDPGVFPLNPETRSALQLGYVQPLLQGRGAPANRAPIILARIDTERSFFQFKDSVQELVRGVIEAYWNLVFARTDAWARRQQVEQGQFAFELARARLETGFGEAADVAQTQVALFNFRATLIAAEANVLQREAALRNLLGLPPAGPERLVPTTPPFPESVTFDWYRILELSEQFRPDVIELKLILEADQQRLIVAENQAQPRLDAVTLYRWNGLEGETPGGDRIRSDGGQFTDWTLGVNFSVPLGLRAERAGLRRQELLIARDRANLEQGLHSAAHRLAIVVRDVAQFYAQYEAFRQVRAAARVNLEQQRAEYLESREIFLNLLLAITDWGNAVSAEAQTLAQYNASLATLERETGTILETHGVRFFEERFRSIGPLGRLGPERCYPESMRPTPNPPMYPNTGEPSENFFDLNVPTANSSRRVEPAGPALSPPGFTPTPEALPPPRNVGPSLGMPRLP
jgi:outer membrane protein TolC